MTSLKPKPRKSYRGWTEGWIMGVTFMSVMSWLSALRTPTTSLTAGYHLSGVIAGVVLLVANYLYTVLYNKSVDAYNEALAKKPPEYVVPKAKNGYIQ